MFSFSDNDFAFRAGFLRPDAWTQFEAAFTRFNQPWAQAAAEAGAAQASDAPPGSGGRLFAPFGDPDLVVFADHHTAFALAMPRTASDEAPAAMAPVNLAGDSGAFAGPQATSPLLASGDDWPIPPHMTNLVRTGDEPADFAPAQFQVDAPVADLPMVIVDETGFLPPMEAGHARIGDALDDGPLAASPALASGDDWPIPPDMTYLARTGDEQVDFAPRQFQMDAPVPVLPMVIVEETGFLPSLDDILTGAPRAVPVDWSGLLGGPAPPASSDAVLPLDLFAGDLTGGIIDISTPVSGEDASWGLRIIHHV